LFIADAAKATINKSKSRQIKKICVKGIETNCTLRDIT
jgi:hypothetical protein